jgi:hypothetical protein
MPTQFKPGDKVSFTRGMFGSWKGRVVRTYKSYANSYGKRTDMVLIAYTRRNGSFGQYRSQLVDVHLRNVAPEKHECCACDKGLPCDPAGEPT